MLRGRALAASDQATAPGVAVVSRSFADRHFPNGDVLGRQLKGGDWDPAAPWIAIVGVVADVPYEHGVRGGVSPTVYLPRLQGGASRWQFVALRSAAPASVAAELVHAVHAVDPRVPLRDVASMAERLEASAAVPRFRMRLFTLLAAVALAVTGIYGVLAFEVNRRRRETAVRRALGAPPMAILGGVVRAGLGMATIGALAGLAGAFALAQTLSAFLYGVVPHDVAAFATATAVLMAAAFLASALPALRAISTDAVTVLREE